MMEKMPATPQKPAVFSGEMRILQRGGLRMAIRLEKIYWAQLREFALDDDVKLSALIFGICAGVPDGTNRTAHLRCYCLDRLRRQSSQFRLSKLNFDMLAIIAACPTPVLVISSERKIVAFNPTFSTDVLKHADGQNRDNRQPVQLTFSEPVKSIQRKLIDFPRRISSFHVGVITGKGTSHHRARFALLDRTLGLASHLIIYLEQ